MKPPNEPDAGKTGQITERLLVIEAGYKFEDVALGLLFRRLMKSLKFYLFTRTNVADGLERKCGGNFGHRGADQSLFVGAEGRAEPARRICPSA